MVKALLGNSLVKKLPRAVYPNLVTVLNIFLGFYAVINAFRGDFVLAFWCVVGGGIADALDGKVARMVEGYSEFGVQYDSLADVITFGLAPSVIVYNMLGQPTNGLLIWVSFLPLLFGSLRLARFNADLVGFDKDSFVGLPIPAAAFSIISLIPLNTYLMDNGLITEAIWISYQVYFIAVIIYFSVLMFSTFTYQTLPNFTFKGSKDNKVKLMIFIVILPFIILYPKIVFFPIMFVFSASGIINWIIKPKVSKE